MEPPLLPVTGESLPRGTTLEPGARLDILARGFYSPMERAFFDVRVSHPGAPTNSVYETPAEMYAAHEKQTRIPARWVQAIIPPLNSFSFLLTHRTVMSAASWPRLLLWGRISDNSDKYSMCIDIFMKLNEETRRGAHTSSQCVDRL